VVQYLAKTSAAEGDFSNAISLACQAGRLALHGEALPTAIDVLMDLASFYN
jgi:hypothetical protein